MNLLHNHVENLYPVFSIRHDIVCYEYYLNTKVYPGKRAGGLEADMMAANELNAHAFLQVILSFLAFIILFNILVPMIIRLCWELKDKCLLPNFTDCWVFSFKKIFSSFSFNSFVHMGILQSSSKDISSNLALLIGGFETKTGEQVTHNFQCLNVLWTWFVFA